MTLYHPISRIPWSCRNWNSNSQSFLLCSVYIPPDVVPSLFSLKLSFISSIAKGKDIILLGDFNQPDINRENLISSNCSSNLFCNFVFDSNLLQLAKSPTHVKGNILDLILTNSENLVQKLSVHSNEPFSSMKSDHNNALLYHSVPVVKN